MQTKEKTPKKDQGLKVMPVKQLSKQPLSKSKGSPFVRIEMGFIGNIECATAEVVVKKGSLTKNNFESLRKDLNKSLDWFESQVVKK